MKTEPKVRWRLPTHPEKRAGEEGVKDEAVGNVQEASLFYRPFCNQQTRIPLHLKKLNNKIVWRTSCT